MRTSLRYCLCSLYLFVCLAPAAYCTKIPGLKLDKIKRLTDSSVPLANETRTVSHLESFLEELFFEDAVLEDVEITLDTENIPERSLADTDDKGIAPISQKVIKKPSSREANKISTYNASRTPSKRRKRNADGTDTTVGYDVTRNYLKKRK